MKKYSNKLSMKALVEKDIIMKKQEKEMRKAPHFFYVQLSRELKGTQGNSRELEGTQGNLRENSRELEGTQGNSKFFKGSARRSNRRKKTQVKGQRG